MSARDSALHILIKVTEHGAYLSDTLRLHFKELPDRQERAFLSRLCTGTVKRLTEVDFRINGYAKTKTKKMHPVVRNILRMGAYQLLYMDSVPAAAAVNESVKLAKKNGQAKAAGLVNGILRSMERKKVPYPYDERKPVSAAECAVCYSVPEWIAAMYEQRFGIERTREILEAFMEPAPITVRVNTSKISPEELRKRLISEGVGVNEVPVRSADTDGGDAESPADTAAFLLSGAGALELLPSFREGLFFVQDISSMEPAAAAGIRAGDTVIDVCAAPGGKALHAADILAALSRADGPQGLVIARDVSEAKVAKVNENIARAGFTNIRTQMWDARETDGRLAGKADVVIADLPCSGLGVLKRKPEIKFRVTRDDVLALADLQHTILNAVSTYVKPGGRLVFSTCTITEEENGGNVKRFLEEHTDFTLRSLRTILPDELRDGFFVAVMEKRAEGAYR